MSNELEQAAAIFKPGRSLNVKEILVPVDFSRASIQVFKYAVRLATTFGARLTLLHVNQTWPYPNMIDVPLPVDSDMYLEGLQAKLDALVKEPFVGPNLAVRTLLQPSEAPFYRITETARELAVDLIVIATKGTTGLKHILLGSTAERVVRHAPCPVLTVRVPEKNATDEIPDFGMIRHILVPMDLSGNSLKALQYAVPFAERYAARITLLHVLQPISFPSDTNFGVETVATLSNLSEQSALDQLNALTNNIRCLMECHVRLGTPYQEIINEVGDRGVDLVILCTHGHTALQHLLLGSTVERVVHYASCPVLTVRQHEHEFVQC